MCVWWSLDVAIFSGVTLRDRNDKHVLMQNLRSSYLMSGSELRIESTSLQIVPHLLRTYARMYSAVPTGVLTTQRPGTWITSTSGASRERRGVRVPETFSDMHSWMSWRVRSAGMPGT